MTLEQNRAYYASKLAIKTDRPRVMARCPFHEDRHPSLSVNLEQGLWYCHTCCIGGSPIEFEMRFTGASRLEARKTVNLALGITDYDYSRDPEAVYVYRDELGAPLFRKLRYFGKKFLIERREDDRWIPELGNCRRVLYNLPKVLTSNHIFIVEGEKDVDRLESTPLAGLDASGLSKCCSTCNFDGAGKWLPDYSRYFAGKYVAIIHDLDPQGLTHGKMVAASVAHHAAQVKLVTLPNLPEHGDVSDFLDTFSPADLIAVVRATPPYTSQAREILVPAAVFDRTYSPDIDWLVDGIIQRGANGFIGAAPKTGKSWLVEDLAVALASGSRWLGRKTAQCRVALISREDNPGLTRWRLRELATGRNLSMESLTSNLWVNTREQMAIFALDNPETAAEMIQSLKTVKPDIAIFDVLNVLHHAEENDNTEMRHILESLSSIQSEAGCSIAVCHHFNKLREGSLIERLRGSSAISGWAEWIIGLELHADSFRKARFELKAACSPDDLWFTISSEGESAWVSDCPAPISESHGKAGKIFQ